MSRSIYLVALILPLTAACGESEERAAARHAAHRDWCIAEELAVQAGGQIATLDTLSAGGIEMGDRLYPFARAMYDFAKARERELALMDSAVSAGSARDSSEL